MELAKYFDHTLLKPDAREADVRRLCEEAAYYGTASVCVNPDFVPLCHNLLEGSGVKTCTVIGFPLGASASKIKADEAAYAVAEGADEVDMVINISAAKDHRYSEVEKDIRMVREAVPNAILKVILETCLLTKEEIAECCLAAKRAKADFVKTSTGFSKGGATVEDVKLMRETVGPEMGVKASGGVHTREEALAMIEAGATRIGASATVFILKEPK